MYMYQCPKRGIAPPLIPTRDGLLHLAIELADELNLAHVGQGLVVHGPVPQVRLLIEDAYRYASLHTHEALVCRLGWVDALVRVLRDEHPTCADQEIVNYEEHDVLLHGIM